MATPAMLRSLLVQLVVAKNTLDALIYIPGLLVAMLEPTWDDDAVLSNLGERLWALRAA